MCVRDQVNLEVFAILVRMMDDVNGFSSDGYGQSVSAGHVECSIMVSFDENLVAIQGFDQPIVIDFFWKAEIAIDDDSIVFLDD